MIHLPLHWEREEEEEWIHLAQAIIQILRVRLDRTYFAKTENWKHCNKIIFKCVNSAMWPIFNEKVAENWSLWILWIVHRTHKLMKSGSKVRNIQLLFMNSSRLSPWNMNNSICPPETHATKEKKKKKRQTQ